MTRNEKKMEALKRMYALELDQQSIMDFALMDKCTVSQSPDGDCGWPSAKLQKAVDSIEEKYGILVYYMIIARTPVGTIVSMLHVSDHPDEWPSDWKDLERLTPMVRTENLDIPEYSEFGCISVEKKNGSLVMLPE